MYPLAHAILIWAVVLGASSAGVVLAVRALPPVQRAMMRLQKPWACDICMGFWTTGAASLALALLSADVRLLLAAGPAYPLTLWLLRKLQEPQHPPALPPLIED